MPMLRCDEIEATSSTQVRVKLERAVIDMYTQDLLDGAEFPPVDIFNEGGGSKRNILADGFHRLIAHVNAGREEIAVEIHKGGMLDALMFALGANERHGLRRSNADKRHAVEMALKDPAISQMTRQEIADICGVTKRTVQKIANHEAVKPDDEDSPPEKPRKPNGDDVRPSRPEPTQEEIERDELRGALASIRAFPYAGDDVSRLELEADDIDDLAYVSEWCAQAVLALTGE